MAGLIHEIQRDASDESIPVAQLLRRMKMAAAKLKLPELGSWVEQELNGYDSDTALPMYRVIAGIPMAHFPGRGWHMMKLGQDEKLNTVYSINFCRDSVAEVEGHAQATEPHIISFPEWLERGTLPELGHASKIGLFVSNGKYRAILNGVRNKSLEWALAVEAEGVTGDGLTFTPEDAKKAQNVSTYYLYGPNARINHDSIDNSTNTVVHGDVFGGLRANIQEAVTDTALQARLIEAVDAMEQTKNTNGFVGAYQNFVGLAADHIQVLQWALPLLATYMSLPK